MLGKRENAEKQNAYTIYGRAKCAFEVFSAFSHFLGTLANCFFLFCTQPRASFCSSAAL